MAIVLPEFKTSYCQVVAACGELLENTAQIESLRAAKSRVARYQRPFETVCSAKADFDDCISRRVW